MMDGMDETFFKALLKHLCPLSIISFVSVRRPSTRDA